MRRLAMGSVRAVWVRLLSGCLFGAGRALCPQVAWAFAAVKAPARTASCLCILAALGGCLGAMPTSTEEDRALKERLSKLQQPIGEVGQSGSWNVCDATQADLSRWDKGQRREVSYRCVSLARIQAGRSALSSPRQQLLRAPCPADRYEYRVEPDDSLRQLSAHAMPPGFDWRVWAAAVWLRNPHCFSGDRKLAEGCTLKIPDVGDTRWHGDLVSQWNSGARPEKDAPLAACVVAWKSAGGRR